MRVGVDEAGKGPVIGSMFAAAVRAPADAIPEGVADSKTLSPERRETLAERLRGSAAVDSGLAEIPVDRIDDPNTDMNTLTLEAHAAALDRVVAGGETVVVDAGDTDAGRFGRRVSDRLEDVTVQAEHGADESHAIVAAASIVAKVARDAHVARLAAEYGDLGSGYPSDEQTRRFLRRHVAEHGTLPECARASWRTSEEVIAAVEQSTLPGLDGDENITDRTGPQ